MLDPHDAIVVERDARLPGLRTLLDDGVFAETLRRLCPDREIGAARATYVRYKPHTSCLVSYTVEVAGAPVRVYARCHAEDDPVKVANAGQRLDVAGPLGPGLLADAEAGIAVFVYPNDYEVRSLRKLFEAERTPPRMRRILPSHPHLHLAEPELLRYKPERRFVGRLSAPGGPPVALRLYPEAQYGQMREKAWAFRSADDLRVPRVVGDSQRYGALAQEWVEGSRLTDLLGGGSEVGEVLGRTARALASLHKQRPALGAMYGASDFCRLVRSACLAVAATHPGLGERATSLMAPACDLVMHRRWRSRAVHGDFTADQVVVGPERITILDFDRAGYGDPGMDVGDFAAGLISHAVEGRLSMATAAGAGAEFARSYWACAGEEDELGARAFTAGALLMMAPEPFRRRRPDWAVAVSALLDSAERVLQREPIDA